MTCLQCEAVGDLLTSYLGLTVLMVLDLLVEAVFPLAPEAVLPLAPEACYSGLRLHHVKVRVHGRLACAIKYLGLDLKASSQNAT